MGAIPSSAKAGSKQSPRGQNRADRGGPDPYQGSRGCVGTQLLGHLSEQGRQRRTGPAGARHGPGDPTQAGGVRQTAPRQRHGLPELRASTDPEQGGSSGSADRPGHDRDRRLQRHSGQERGAQQVGDEWCRPDQLQPLAADPGRLHPTDQHRQYEGDPHPQGRPDRPAQEQPHRGPGHKGGQTELQGCRSGPRSGLRLGRMPLIGRGQVERGRPSAQPAMGDPGVQREDHGQAGEEGGAGQGCAHNAARAEDTIERNHARPRSWSASPTARTILPTQLPVSQDTGSAPIH